MSHLTLKPKIHAIICYIYDNELIPKELKCLAIRDKD